jgi:hypothetical protein
MWGPIRFFKNPKGPSRHCKNEEIWLTMPHFPDAIMTSLKETVVNVFWKKTDVKSLFRKCGVPGTLMGNQDWEGYKINAVTPVLDYLNEHEDGIGPLRQILQETLSYQDGDHLLWMSDGRVRKQEAERCLKRLRQLVANHDAAVRTDDEERLARQRKAEEDQRQATFRTHLQDIHTRFLSFFQASDKQGRGYSLETILYDLFTLFELSPRGPFRRVGEQIDGAFVHCGDPFLLEAKWQQKPCDLNDLRDLDGAVGSSLDNTLGLFVSINGFSEESITGYLKGHRPRLICMDGSHLMTVLEGRIDFSDLLIRLRDAAVHKKNILIPVKDIFAGKA